MITITAIQKQVSDVKHQIENEVLKPTVEKRLRNKIPFFNQLIMYLETNPSEDFIQSEVSRIEYRIEETMKLFPEEKYKDVAKKDFLEAKKDFEKLHNIPKLKDQLKVLKFLLNN